jgi:ketosteroid isomerase-like protein
MQSVETLFQDLYKNFNARNIDAVIDHMTPDVKWANGMEGGFVHGHKGVKEYWLRQFKMISAKVTPLKIDQEGDTVTINVHQVVHDLDGNLLADEELQHIFTLRDGKVALFEIAK